jgi:hypothetical protein
MVRAIESLLFSLTFRQTFEGSSCTRTSATRRKSYSQIRAFRLSFLDQRGTIQRFAAVLPFIFGSAAFCGGLPRCRYSTTACKTSLQNNSKQFIDMPPLRRTVSQAVYQGARSSTFHEHKNSLSR